MTSWDGRWHVLTFAVACVGVLVLFVLVSAAAYAADRRTPARPHAEERAGV